MARQKRIVVFVNDSELEVLQSVRPPDASIGATVRRLAIDRSQWLIARSERQHVNQPRAPSDNDNDNDLAKLMDKSP